MIKKEEILEALEKAGRDLSIQEIADLTHISRDTVSKYIGILEAEAKIEMAREIGRARMYCAKKIGSED